MTYALKRSCALVTLFLFALSRGDLFGYTRQQQQQQQQRHGPAPLPWHLAPPWEYILREIVLKSVNPSPRDAGAAHERPMDATFYGGPIAAYSSNDANVVLSRGNVYRLLNGHWMLCQDGCVDCVACAARRNPAFKWVLRRVERLPAADPPRHDLQLTIIPQTDDRLHASNPWPNSYVYVMSQGERAPPVSVGRTRHGNERENSLSSLESSFSENHHRSKDPRRLTERDSIASQQESARNGKRIVVPGNASTEKTEKEESPVRKHRFENMRRHRAQPRPAEKSAEEANHLMPKLILGTDQRGQKHLIHMVPADHPSTASSVNPSAPNQTTSLFATGQTARSNGAIPQDEKQTYQRIFRRVFDSLNTHRRSIEDFLESPADNTNGPRTTPSSTDNMETAGFSWSDRDTNRTSARNFKPLRFDDATLPSSYAGNEDRTGTHQYRSKQLVNDYFTEHRDTNQSIMLRGQSPAGLDWDGERREVHVKPYSVNGKSISRINSTTSLESSDDSSTDAISKSDSNGLVVNSAKSRIDLNDTFVNNASSNSMESSSVKRKRENGWLFKSERPERHHSLRLFVGITTESPVIRRKHETLNRTETFQMTTSKTFADT